MESTQAQQQQQPEEPLSILSAPNSRLGSFTFLASSGPRNEGSYFCNDFVGFPSVPLLGQYGKMGYDINEIKMLSVHECECSAGKILASSSQEEIILPNGLEQLLLNIPNTILNNKPILYDDDQYNQIPNLQENEPHFPDPHEFDFPKTTSFNFAWTVQFQDSSIDIIQRPVPMNLVLHSFIYPVVDLMGKKRICCDVPACVFPAEEEPGIQPWTNDFRSVSFGSLRSEFLAVHLRGGVSLCFSPNNLKFEINPDVDISHFYSFVLTEDGFYQVTYHWNVNNSNLFNPLDKIFDKSKDTKEIIQNLGELLGTHSGPVQTLHQIFKNSLKEDKKQEQQDNQTIEEKNQMSSEEVQQEKSEQK